MLTSRRKKNVNGKRSKQLRRLARQVHWNAVMNGELKEPETNEELRNQLRAIYRQGKKHFKRFSQSGAIT
jgi:transcriptional/translational regulatory protein YebC/TACO1